MNQKLTFLVFLCSKFEQARRGLPCGDEITMSNATLKSEKRGRHSLYQAALDADARFSRELVRVYGKKAHLARYRPSDTHTDPTLLSALQDKEAADEAWFNHIRRSREVSS